MNLSDLKILALDCQATGVNPNKGQLLEIGWVSDCAASREEPQWSSVRSYLLRLPVETQIPHAVRRITGISNESAAAHAVPEKTVWQHLMDTVKATAAENRPAVCPTIIHFARFEAPFLQKLHQANDPGIPFPFELICTHAIAVRLLPDLPRRSIRALAGYFGHSMPELKRSADHALATVSIWKRLVELLQTRCNVCNLPQLTGWLEATHPPKRSRRSFPIDPCIRRAVPEKPGIYRMRRSNADILYIGKAKSLRQRVNSYFRGNAAHPEHVLEMLTQAWGLDFSLTETALEAAIFESDEIKQHEPPYNISLRSGDRSLVFCTRDLKRHSTGCDRFFCLGPLPGGKRIDALHAFENWLANGTPSNGNCLTGIGYAAFAAPSIMGPSIRCLEEGLGLFRSRHLDRLEDRTALRMVTALGARLWQQNRTAAASCESDGDMEAGNRPLNGQDIEPEEGERRWTPAGIAAGIEGILLRGAHLMRRARWFCLLSESTVAWTHADQPDTLKNAIVFEKGAVVYRGVLHAGQKPPVPPGFARSFHARQRSFDLTTYDRMRVLTTELRRLLCEGRRIEVLLKPTVKLTSWELEKALQWV